MNIYRASFSSQADTDTSSKNGEISISNFEHKKKKYQLINNDLRKQVVHKIEFEKNSIKQAALECHIKLSTCKAIYKIYQKEGRLEKKKHRLRKKSKQTEKTQKKCSKSIVFQSFKVNIKKFQPFSTESMKLIKKSLALSKQQKLFEKHIKIVMRAKTPLLQQDTEVALMKNSTNSLFNVTLGSLWENIFSFFSQ